MATVAVGVASVAGALAICPAKAAVVACSRICALGALGVIEVEVICALRAVIASVASGTFALHREAAARGDNGRRNTRALGIVASRGFVADDAPGAKGRIAVVGRKVACLARPALRIKVVLVAVASTVYLRVATPIACAFPAILTLGPRKAAFAVAITGFRRQWRV